MYHPLSRPDYCEAQAIQLILHLAETTGGVRSTSCTLHRIGLKAIEEARRRGMTVYAEVCPQHLLLDDSCYLEPDTED